MKPPPFEPDPKLITYIEQGYNEPKPERSLRLAKLADIALGFFLGMCFAALIVWIAAR
jgi:hypothetical protein